MTYEVVFRQAAQREHADAVSWYEERRAGLGAEFASEMERAIEAVAQIQRAFRSCTGTSAAFARVGFPIQCSLRSK
jgi:hypothetical protein